MKKIILLFVGAAASFLVFSYIDEYESLIRPLLSEKKNDRPFVTVREGDIKSEIKETLVAFHKVLANAYLASDPSMLMRPPVDQRLIPTIAQEIDYLTREGKFMDMRVSDISIHKIVSLAPTSVMAETEETVEISYYANSSRQKIISYPPVYYDIRYSFNWRNNRWYVISFETIGIRGQERQMVEETL